MGDLCHSWLLCGKIPSATVGSVGSSVWSIMTQGIFSINFWTHDLFFMCVAVAGHVLNSVVNSFKKPRLVPPGASNTQVGPDGQPPQWWDLNLDHQLQPLWWGESLGDQSDLFARCLHGTCTWTDFHLLRRFPTLQDRLPPCMPNAWGLRAIVEKLRLGTTDF